MDGSSDSAPNRDELVFFGTISASLCHELKNVFATIGELSGLLADLGAASGATGRLSAERLQSICGRIEQQVDRGEGYTRLLSRFSHSVDEPLRRVDLDDLIAQTVECSRRFSYIEQVSLEVSVPDEAVTVELDPFACEHALFLCIRLALKAATERRVVTVGLEAGDGGPSIAVSSADPFRRDMVPAADLALVESVVQRLGGRVRWVSEPERDRVTICLER